MFNYKKLTAFSVVFMMGSVFGSASYELKDDSFTEAEKLELTAISANILERLTEMQHSKPSGNQLKPSNFPTFASNPGEKIGQIKPNASDEEKFLLRDKIMDTIIAMKKSQKTEISQLSSYEIPDCYIELSPLERVPGKCKKINEDIIACTDGKYVGMSGNCKSDESAN